jgi:hypothetical protein
MIKIISPQGNVVEASEKAFRKIYATLGFVLQGEQIAEEVTDLAREIKAGLHSSVEAKKRKEEK